MKICASTLKKETNISSETLLNLYRITFATSLRVSVLLVLMFRHVREVVLVRIESDTVVIVFRSIFSPSSKDYQNGKGEDASTCRPGVSFAYVSCCI